jgi:cystathionine beta-synthase
MNDLRVYNRISEAVGWTPMVRLGPTVDDFDCEVFAKIEFLNPMGSVKDRIARFMIDNAIADGRLSAGDLVVENSSGNTAMGLAMMSVLEDLRCTMVVRSQTSKEKLDCLRAMGIDLVLVDGDLPPDDPESYNRKAKEIVASTPGAYFPDQHNNRENSEAHYRTTGPEIWKQMNGRIDFLVAGIGTGGTICGVARFLKEQDPSIEVIAIDPEGSVFFDHFHTGTHPEPEAYLIEGLGDEEIIGCPNFDLIDDMYRVTDREAFRAARGLARREAILGGGSSGAALWGVRELARRIGRPARIVTIFNDDWMKEHGFL